MKNLMEILEKAKMENDINTIIKDIEIYLAQESSISLLEYHNNYIRILPKNSMYYIDILEDTFDTIDERNYIVLKILYDKDLLKYVEKMWIHEGSIRLILRETYLLKDVKNIFDKYVSDILHSFNEKNDVFSGDLYEIQFYDKDKSEYIS